MTHCNYFLRHCWPPASRWVCQHMSEIHTPEERPGTTFFLPQRWDAVIRSHTLEEMTIFFTVRLGLPSPGVINPERQNNFQGISYFFICSFFIHSFFINKFFIHSFYIPYFFIHSFFYGSFFIIQNLLLQPNIKKIIFIHKIWPIT